MNKILKTFLFSVLCFIGSILTMNVVKADTLHETFIDGIYYVHTYADGSNRMAYQLGYFYVDGRLSYCVEPGVDIYSTNYNVGNWDITSLSAEQRHRIEMIGYYGYEYPGHQTPRYYAATQELIWNAVRPMNVSWSTGSNGSGSPIDLSPERNEILRLISIHDSKPSFNGTTATGVIGDTITLTDTNNQLSRFKVSSSGSNNASIDGNNLNIKLNDMGTQQVVLDYKTYDDDITLVYYNSNSQKMAHLRLSDPTRANLNVKVVAGKVSIEKVDKDTGKATPQGDATLEGAKYNVYDESGNYITSINTNAQGKATSVNLENLGKYYIQEDTPSVGYLLDNTKYYFDMTRDNLYPTVQVKEKVIEREFEITKVYASDKTVLMTPETNIDFGIYNSKNELVKKLTTDSEGKIYFKLPYGKYTLKQLTSPKTHEKIEDYNFEVKEIGATINKVFSNAEYSARIKVIKVDDEGNVITKAGIKFKIKNLDTNEYVCQRVSYPKTITYCEFETGEDGTLLTPYPLNSGNYQLEELDQVIYGYVWNSNPLKFSINEDSNIITSDDFDSVIELKFENKEVKGKIIINKTGEEVLIKNGSFKYVEKELSNVKFGLYDMEGNLIKEVKTDSNGYAEITDLKLNSYILKELETNEGYVLDTKEYKVELKYKDQYTPVVIKVFNLNNELEKGTLDFSKTDLTSGKGIPNVKLSILTENDEVIFTGLTDSKGKIKIDNLFKGKFKIVEVEAATGYRISDEEVYFEIKENGEIVKANMTNEKFKGTLEFTKIDISTSEPLPNTLIKITNKETGEVVFTGRTDENGKIVIENLEYGNYILTEEEAPEGYKLNPNPMEFSILEDGQVVKATMTDEKIEMPKTFDTNIVSIIIMSISTLIGVGLIWYAKNKKD